MTREDAIKGLRNIANWHYGKYEQTGEEDYLNDGDFLTDVANMLKAQEPRVMTLEDVRELHDNDVVWLEDVDNDIVIPGICCGVKKVCTDFTQFLTRDPIHPYVFLIHNQYGQRWRCWTSRPTGEQM